MKDLLDILSEEKERDLWWCATADWENKFKESKWKFDEFLFFGNKLYIFFLHFVIEVWFFITFYSSILGVCVCGLCFVWWEREEIFTFSISRLWAVTCCAAFIKRWRISDWCMLWYDSCEFWLRQQWFVLDAYLPSVGLCSNLGLLDCMATWKIVRRRMKGFVAFTMNDVWKCRRTFDRIRTLTLYESGEHVRPMFVHAALQH